AHVGHPLIGGAFDHVRVGLEQLDAQQPIMVRRLVFERNPQPLVIWIECLGHTAPEQSCQKRFPRQRLSAPPASWATSPKTARRLCGYNSGFILLCRKARSGPRSLD